MTIKNGTFVLPDIWHADDALQALKEGNERFVIGERRNYDLGFERRKHLSLGQAPHTVVLTCSDSRVPPERVFDQGLGDLFTLRIAGNILSREEIGSMEYAVEFLDSCLIVIMGHESCGAVTAAVDSTFDEDLKTTPNLDGIIGRLKTVVSQTNESHPNLSRSELVEKCVDENVSFGIKNLVAQSDLIVDKMKTNKVKVIGAKYILDTGRVEFGEFYQL